ncbi:hypothetical protein BJ875DRAFT_493904 [Amylocarpus encephaloides]|uniref:Peptidase C14 caspase domain-containing protein n=1 Tax=Amylocarpus encephaloides TaxID=45428 RepID=A0A9P8C7V7_9HELO|nr:hypothetical protein BJ875DRAFT_493904 [Amylocarpus encephaloides]
MKSSNPNLVEVIENRSSQHDQPSAVERPLILPMGATSQDAARSEPTKDSTEVRPDSHNLTTASASAEGEQNTQVFGAPHPSAFNTENDYVWPADFVKVVSKKRVSGRYTSVKVLMFYWINDDLGVQSEVYALAAVLRGDFGFDTRISLIPLYNPQEFVEAQVKSIIDDSPTTLVIFYYAGHGDIEPAIRGGFSESYWSGSVESDLQVAVSSVQKIVEATFSDALLIYDCCAASNPGFMDRESIRPGQNGTTLQLAACRWDDMAEEVGDDSFTSSLIDVLKTAALRAKPLAVSDLYRRISLSLKKKALRRNKKLPSPVLSRLTIKVKFRDIVLPNLTRKALKKRSVHSYVSMMTIATPNNGQNTFLLHPNLVLYSN